MAKMSKETLERVIREVYGLEIPEERLKIISKVVTQTLEALERSSVVGLESLEPSPNQIRERAERGPSRTV